MIILYNSRYNRDLKLKKDIQFKIQFIFQISYKIVFIVHEIRIEKMLLEMTISNISPRTNVTSVLQKKRKNISV